MTCIVVIGGVAAGMSAASQAKRRQPDAEVVALERGPYVSYGACGIPYNLMAPERDIEDLVVISPERFRKERHIDVRTRHEARSIDPRKRSIVVQDLAAARDYTLHYDELVIATGATAVKPPLAGIDLPGVSLLRELSDGAAIKQRIARHDMRRAVIIGAGYIGLEMAEALRSQDIEVTILERAPQAVPGFDPQIAEPIARELQAHGVMLHTQTTVTGIEAAAKGLLVTTQDSQFPADMVLVSVGVRPRVALAVSAGVTLGAGGAIAVDAAQRTNIEHIFAAGDCAEAYHRVLRQSAYIPLGTTANKQGKIAGANAVGAHEQFAGIVGTAAFKLFDLELGRTGLSALDIENQGMDAVAAVSTHKSRGHHYPGSQDITTVVYAERGSRRVLGVQMVGADTVAKRIDIFATALTCDMTVDDVAALDLSYAPPFAPVYDPVIIAASVAQKKLAQ